MENKTAQIETQAKETRDALASFMRDSTDQERELSLELYDAFSSVFDDIDEIDLDFIF